MKMQCKKLKFLQNANEELNKYGEVLSKHASGFKQENWKKKFIEFCENKYSIRTWYEFLFFRLW